jgi:hypothetical protein
MPALVSVDVRNGGATAVHGCAELPFAQSAQISTRDGPPVEISSFSGGAFTSNVVFASGTAVPVIIDTRYAWYVCTGMPTVLCVRSVVNVPPAAIDAVKFSIATADCVVGSRSVTENGASVSALLPPFVMLTAIGSGSPCWTVGGVPMVPVTPLPETAFDRSSKPMLVFASCAPDESSTISFAVYALGADVLVG